MSKAPPAAARYLSIPEAAEYLGVAPLTIRRNISRGNLTGYRLGTKIIRVDREELASLLRPIPTTGGDHVA